MPEGERQRVRDERGEPISFGEFGGFEVYPMPFFATLECEDINSTVAWYRDALGFGVMFTGPEIAGQPSLVHLRRHKYQDVLLRPSAPAQPAAAMPRLTLTFNADGEVDELAARAREVAPVRQSKVEAPANTPWNTRDLRATDPEGNALIFTARRTDIDPEAEARMREMFERSLKGQK